MLKFYLTAAIPYVNAPPHIGHALEFVQTDVVSRYHRILGENVLALCGGDENALKNVRAAQEEKIPIQQFVDRNNRLFEELTRKLNVRFDVWQKGSDRANHFPASQKLWQLCARNGDIYKKRYGGLYCVGCETFLERGELNAKGECPEHPGKKLEKVEEENYFFRLSRYQRPILDLIQNDQLIIIPLERKNEVSAFIKEGLRDLSISRSNQRAQNWGVPVPQDPTQRIYVWFDALNIYQSGVGFGSNQKKYQKWWPADLQVIGKGIVRFHAVYWPAFLLSAGLKPPKQIFAHGYLTVNGQKMSKTLGNVYDPLPLLEKYGADPLRYFLLSKCHPYKDSDFSEDKFRDVYNADLANGLGNLVSRLAKLCELGEVYISQSGAPRAPRFASGPHQAVANFLATFRFDLALDLLWNEIRHCDQQIEEQRLWENPERMHPALMSLVERVRGIARDLEPFLPETANKIIKIFKGPRVRSPLPLFPRLLS